MNWLYNGKEITDISQFPLGTFGFIYEVSTPEGKKYIGKKTAPPSRKKKSPHFFLLISFLWLSSLLSPHFLILFDSFLLFWGWFLHILLFEFFHPFIQSPWSFEILIFRLPLVLSFLLVFATYLFLGFFCLRFFKF